MANNYKEFNLEKALAGDPVITGNGENVTRLHLFECKEKFKLYGVKNGSVFKWTKEGNYWSQGLYSIDDLFMAPNKITKWVNVYSDGNGGYYSGTYLYDSEETAKYKAVITAAKLIATKPVTFEE